MIDREAFKQRMQGLKSYRELNPGKGYIEFMEELAAAKAKEWHEDDDIILTEMLNDNTYNYKLMYEDNPNYNILEGHFEDTYKTVYHPTFSEESMYSGKKSQYNPEGIKGGWWDYDNKIFHANPKLNIKYTLKYLDRADPGWKVLAFVDGGEIPPTYTDKLGNVYTEEEYQDYLRNSTDEINKFTGLPMVRGLNPVVDLEDATGFTPVGDALSVKDAYDAVKDRNWLGAGLSALSILPFIPSAKKLTREVPVGITRYTDKIDEMDRRNTIPNQVLSEYHDQRNRTYELLNTPEARRRAAAIDKKYGTEYTLTYDKLTKEYEDTESFFNMPEPAYVSNPDAYATINPKEGGKINLSREYNNVDSSGEYNMLPGLIRHEIGHRVDDMAYPSGIRNNAYLLDLAKPSKYREFDEVKGIFKDPSKAKLNYDYLRTPTEKKSIMNSFDEYLMLNYTPTTYPSTLKEFRKAIETAPSGYDSMKMLLKMHVSPKTLFKDFTTIPLVNNSKRNNNLV